MILKGKPVADQIKQESVVRLIDLKDRGINPKLVIVRLGNNPGDISYEKSLLNYNASIGLETEVIEKDRSINTEELLSTIERLNLDDGVNGILVFRPLPRKLDISIIANSISLSKDVDAMNPNNLLPLFLGKKTRYEPSTARAVMEILNFYKIDLEGKNVVIVNRSEVVGKPLSMMFLKEDATVTICHSRTRNLRKITRSADIVVTALGKSRFFDESYFNSDAILIDVGMSLDENKKLSGDLDYEKLLGKIRGITPVPGGVGRITTSILIKQMLDNIK